MVSDSLTWQASSDSVSFIVPLRAELVVLVHSTQSFHG